MRKIVSREHKLLHKDKEKVFDYWEKSTRRMKEEGAFSSRKDEMIFDHTWVTTAKAFLVEGRIREGDRILDVGCGWGRSISGVRYFVPNSTVVGLDSSRTRLGLARKTLDDLDLGSGVELVVGDADDLSFEDNSFDAVISARLLQYVPEPVHTIKEFRRVLKPGGWVVITVPNKLNPIRCLTYGRVLYTSASVRRWFVENELSDISCRTIGFIPTFRRAHWQSKWLYIEKLQSVPILNLMGGLVLCSGRKVG